MSKNGSIFSLSTQKRYGIKCCKDCKPPKRHAACHATCKTYKDEKAEYERNKQKERDNINECQVLRVYDFEKWV